MAISFAEVNSFVGKFVNLWKTGRDANLNFETHAGQACVILRLGLGEHPYHQDQEQHDRRRLRPSQQRRRERRAAARIVSAENAVNIKETESEKASGAEDIVDEQSTVKATLRVEDEVCKDKDFASFAEEAEKVDDEDVTTEEVEAVDQSENDCDMYTFRYWNNQKQSEAQEALDYIEEQLKHNFKKNKVKDSDQVFKVFNVESLDENEIQVKIKMKKDNWPVERSARNVQTSGEHIPVSVSIKNIQR